MEYLGFGLLALVVFGGLGLLIYLMRRTRRNEGSTHGGGYESRSRGVEMRDNL